MLDGVSIRDICGWWADPDMGRTGNGSLRGDRIAQRQAYLEADRGSSSLTKPGRREDEQ